PAGARIVEHTVGDAVAGITRRVHRVVDERQPARRHIAARVLVQGQYGPEMAAGLKAGPVDRGRPGDNAVVVIGITLSLHETLAAAGRATDVIRTCRRASIECRGDLLGVLGGDVEGAMAE